MFPSRFFFNVYNLFGYLYNKEGQPPSAISIEYSNNNNNNKS